MPPFLTPVLIGVASAAALLVLGIRLLPARWSCPRCHHASAPIEGRWLGPLGLFIERRWCPRCHWSAFSRRRHWVSTPTPPPEPLVGFDWKDSSPAQPIGGQLGFDWGAPGRETPVFEWKGDPPAPPPPPGSFQWREAVTKEAATKEAAEKSETRTGDGRKNPQREIPFRWRRPSE